MKLFNIQTASQLSGVSAHCIRAWEKRYRAITPGRSENGRRLYTEDQLKRLTLLGKLASLGNSIGMIAKLPDQELEEMLISMASLDGQRKSFMPLQAKTNQLQEALVSPEDYLQNLLMALHFYKLDVLSHEMNKASMDLGYKKFATLVLVPLFHKIGHLVELGKLSIAQEHTLSALAKFFIGKQLNRHSLSATPKKAKVVLATPTGEHHSLGILLSALILAEHNYEIFFLGEDLPASSLADAAKAIESQAVVLGISDHYNEMDPQRIQKYLQELRAALPKGVSICLGGGKTEISQRYELQLTQFKSLDHFDQALQEQTFFMSGSQMFSET
jgi:DNA-binding transcriptional MerR regulator/methylmalonyl-CoA mutase cobalamin-binding subunit